MNTDILIAFASFLVWSWICYRLGRRAERRATRDKPATDKQRAFIATLARERGVEPPDTSGITRSQASLLIDELKSR